MKVKPKNTATETETETEPPKTTNSSSDERNTDSQCLQPSAPHGLIWVVPSTIVSADLGCVCRHRIEIVGDKPQHMGKLIVIVIATTVT